jgi:lipoprotein-anchoring transpeptidase ErfK/SrfK
MAANFMRSKVSILVYASLLIVFTCSIYGQFRLFGPRSPKPTPQPKQMRTASQLISRQAPLKVNQGLLQQATPDNTRIVVSIPKQRTYLMIGDQIVADGPVSSGKRGHETPTGHFTVMEKDPNHHSSLYGNFVDGSGRIVRGGVSAQVDSAPSGTHFAGAPMKWFLRLTGEGVGMHVGILPGYAASHGCIRESDDGAKLFYDHVKVGTPINVGDY